MPLRSEKQRRFLHWAESRGVVPKGTAAKFEAETPKSVKKKLPLYVKGSPAAKLARSKKGKRSAK